MVHFVMTNEILIISILHLCFAFVIVLVGEFNLRCEHFFFHYIAMDSVLLVLHIGETSIAT